MFHGKIFHSLQKSLKPSASFDFKILMAFLVFLFLVTYTSTGQTVSKGDIKITDKTGKPIDSVILVIPDEDAPKEKSIEVVKDSHLINPKSEYIIDAEGHKAEAIKGIDLIKHGGAKLKQAPNRFAVVSPGDNPKDAAKETAMAIYILTGEAERDQEKEARFLLDYHLKNFREKMGRDPTGTEKDKGIESVVPYLQPIFIFDTSWESTESVKEFCIIKPESLFGFTSKSLWKSKDEIGDDEFNESIITTDLSAAIGPSLKFERAKLDAIYGGIIIGGHETPLFGRLDLKVDWNGGNGKGVSGSKISTVDDLSEIVTPDDPGVDKTFSMPGLDFWSGGRTWNRNPIIIKDDPRSIQEAETFPNDPLFRSRGSWGQGYFDQWGLRRIGFKPSDGKKKSLWPEKTRPVIIAVIDTGIDRSHPEISASLWKNEKEIPGNSVDDDKNGYIDDVYGWNFVDKNNDIRDINGHGTITAGIIAALTNNRIGIAGVNPFAKIMPIKAMEWNGRGWAFDIAKAIIYAANNGARVINISIGGKRLNRMELLAVHYARRKGAIVVAAAGNEGLNTKEFSPAGLPGVVTVSATGPDDKRVGFSGWGAGVDIAAPGVDILSLRAKRTDLLKFEKKDYRPEAAFVGRDKDYYRVTGTSFSAPFVSGVASLILGKNPKLSGMQLTRMILHSAKDIDVPGWDQFTGYGLLDAGAAMKADPDFYVLSRIFKVAGTKKEGKFFIKVSGHAMANNFKRAWIEAGKGSDPAEWVKVSDDITWPVNMGQLALILPKHFRGEKQWTLRLIVEHQNGFKRESRFKLKLG